MSRLIIVFMFMLIAHNCSINYANSKDKFKNNYHDFWYDLVIINTFIRDIIAIFKINYKTIKKKTF